MDKEKLSTSANLLRLSTLGINFSLCTFVGIGLGWLVNHYFHWGGWIIMVGMLFGVIASYTLLFEDLKALNEKPKDPKAR